MFEDPDLFAVPGGPLVLERTDRFGYRLRAVLRPPGAPSRQLPLPAGADVTHLTTTGGVAAVAVPRLREVQLMALDTGAVAGRRPLGPFADMDIISLGVAANGDVALTVEDGGGADFLGWARGRPRAADRPQRRQLRARPHAERPHRPHRPARDGDGERVLVLDVTGPEPRELFRGPLAAAVRALDFRRTHVAWSSDGCQFVAPATASASGPAVPAGPCLHTEATFAGYLDGRRHRTVRQRIRCLTAPGPRCRSAYGMYLGGQRVARATRTVRVGGRREVRVPISRRVRARLEGRVLGVVALVVDPGGRAREAFTDFVYWTRLADQPMNRVAIVSSRCTTPSTMKNAVAVPSSVNPNRARL